MKPSILRDFSQLQERLMGYVTSMHYQYSQLCVKGDPSLLLGIEMESGGVPKRIEELADVMVYQEEDKQDRIDLIPKGTNANLPILAQGVFEYYPEIKQSVETDMTDDEMAEAEASRKEAEEKFGVSIPPIDKPQFLKLLMPDVDDDRKKFLEDAVKVIHDASKAVMDATSALFTAQITAKLPGESPESVKEIKDQLESVKKQYEDAREKLTQNKLEDIQKANWRYHQKPAAEQQHSASDDSWKKLKVN